MGVGVGAALRQVEQLRLLPVGEVSAVPVLEGFFSWLGRFGRGSRCWRRRRRRGWCRHRLERWSWRRRRGLGWHGSGGWRRRRTRFRGWGGSRRWRRDAISRGGAEGGVERRGGILLRRRPGRGSTGQGLTRLAVTVDVQLVWVVVGASGGDVEGQRLFVGVEVRAVAVGAEGVVAHTRRRSGTGRWRGQRRGLALGRLQQHRRGAGGEHLRQRRILGLGDGQPPVALDGGPVHGVGTPVALQGRTPFLGAFGSLGAVGRADGGDEMVLVSQMVGEFTLAVPVPGPATGAMGVSQRHHVVDVQVTGAGDDLAGVRPLPAPGGHLAPLIGLKGNGDGGLGYQRLLPRILAVAVLVGPVTPLPAVVIGQVARRRRHRYLQHDARGGGSGSRGRSVGRRGSGRWRNGGRRRERRGRRRKFVHEVAAGYGSQQEKRPQKHQRERPKERPDAAFFLRGSPSGGRLPENPGWPCASSRVLLVARQHPDPRIRLGRSGPGCLRLKKTTREAAGCYRL